MFGEAAQCSSVQRTDVYSSYAKKVCAFWLRTPILDEGVHTDDVYRLTHMNI